MSLKSINHFQNLLVNHRLEYFMQTTIGKLYVPNETTKRSGMFSTASNLIRGTEFGWILEDTVRPSFIKVSKHTAIPETGFLHAYEVEIRYSPAFKAELPVFFTRKEVKNGNTIYHLEHGGISFQYILAHGGNDHEHTDGCLLVAKNRPSPQRIQGSLSVELTSLVRTLLKEGPLGLVVVNSPYSK